MPNCFRCGRLIERSYQPRRNVKTGEHISRLAGKRGVSIRTSFGRRIVCPSCAKEIDWEQGRELRMWRYKLAALLALALILYILGR